MSPDDDSRLDAERSLFRDEDDDGGFGHLQTNSPIPSVIGQFQVVTRLGGGSMAELYLARKISTFGFVRRAVIKQVRRSRPDYKVLQRMLLDEARATACLDHPNLVALFDVGESEHGIFIALEYVEGTDLRRVNSRLQKRKEALPFELACFVVSEVLRGLHSAQTSKGPDGVPLDLIHRDVNPSNVLIARSGHVKLADFGVASMRERIQQKTEPGLVKGKYAYLAPEYIAGEPCSIQTDVYAAGIMLFELLSGRECFSGNSSYEVMWKIVNKGVPMYRLMREGVPEDLQRIVQRATSMVPERRYATAQDMSNALEAWLMRSGRHATPWVLSVFFNRHDLFPKPIDETRTPLPIPAIAASLPTRSGSTGAGEAASEGRMIQETISRSSEARVVDDTLTPAPDIMFSAPPGQFEVPILPPAADEARTESAAAKAIRDAQWRTLQSSGSHASDSAPPRLPPRTHASSESPPRTPATRPPAPVTEPPLRARTPAPHTEPPPPRMPPSTSDLIAPPAAALPQPERPSRRGQIDAAQTIKDPLPPGVMNTPSGIRIDQEVTRPFQALSPSMPPPTTAPKTTPTESPRRVSPPSDQSGPFAPVNPTARGASRAPMPPPSLDRPLTSGKLEDMPAAEVMGHVNSRADSGVIEFRCGLIWKRVFVVDGVPTGITSNMGMELIGEHLVKARIISREDLDRALQKSERQGKSLTSMLLEQGSLDRPTLEEELGRNLAARLQEVLDWRWGTYELTVKPMEPAEIVPKLDLAAVLERARKSRAEADGTDNGHDREHSDSPEGKLQEALEVARSIAESSGKGRVERPWRSNKR